MTEQTIELTGVNAGFGSKTVVADATLTVRTNEILALAGPNGAGKSTLLKTMARQLPPLSGTVSMSKREIWQMSAREFASRIAYVAQSQDAQIDLTVAEFVMLGRNPHQNWWQWSGAPEDTRIVQEALSETDMLHHQTTSMTELSGGERQRAVLAMAIAQEPRFLLLDEPTAHLDYKHQLELVDLLKRQKERGLGIVVVLHDLNLIDALADSIAFLKAAPGAPSSLQATGSASEMMQPDVLQSIFDVPIEALTDATTGKRFFNPLVRHQNQIK